MATLIKLNTSATPGEEKLLSHLENCLPENYIILGNPLINSGRFVREIDAILITPKNRLYVIETKHLHGLVTGDEDAWLVNGKVLHGPINKGLHNAALIKAKIVNRFPKFIDHRVESAVVLTCDDVVLNISDKRVAGIVFKLNETKHFFTRVDKTARDLSHEDTNDILRALVGDIQFDSFKDALHHSDNASPGNQTSKSTPQIYIRLSGANGFQRTYFEDALLCRNEFRGLRGWETLQGQLLSIRFGNDPNIELSPIAGAIEVDSKTVSPGKSIILNKGRCMVDVGGLQLNADIINERTARS